MSMFNNAFTSWRGSLCKVRANEGNVSPHGSVWPGDRRSFEYIKGRVLEGERNNVLDTFEGISQMVSSKAFGDNNFDTTQIISWVPVALR
jgi:hypothetical protein